MIFKFMYDFDFHVTHNILILIKTEFNITWWKYVKSEKYENEYISIHAFSRLMRKWKTAELPHPHDGNLENLKNIKLSIYT